MSELDVNAPVSDTSSERNKPIKRRRRPATELLADFLCAYGSYEDWEPLPDHVVQAYLGEDADARAQRLNAQKAAVFAELMRSADMSDGAAKDDVPGGEVV